MNETFDILNHIPASKDRESAVKNTNVWNYIYDVSYLLLILVVFNQVLYFHSLWHNYSSHQVSRIYFYA